MMVICCKFGKVKTWLPVSEWLGHFTDLQDPLWEQLESTALTSLAGGGGGSRTPVTLASLCPRLRSRAASPGQTNGESSMEVLATRFQVGWCLLLGALRPALPGPALPVPFPHRAPGGGTLTASPPCGLPAPARLPSAPGQAAPSPPCPQPARILPLERW